MEFMVFWRRMELVNFEEHERGVDVKRAKSRRTTAKDWGQVPLNVSHFLLDSCKVEFLIVINDRVTVDRKKVNGFFVVAKLLFQD